MNPARQINQDEKLLRLADVPDAIPHPKPGRKTTIDAVNRWATRGLAGVRLEVLYVGPIRFTSREALGRFFEAVSVAKGQKPRPPAASRAAEQASAALDAAGL